MIGPTFFHYRMIAGRPLDLDRLLPLAIEIADALDAARARAIVHRDDQHASEIRDDLQRLKRDAESGRICSRSRNSPAAKLHSQFKRAFSPCMDTRNYPVK